MWTANILNKYFLNPNPNIKLFKKYNNCIGIFRPASSKPRFNLQIVYMKD